MTLSPSPSGCDYSVGHSQDQGILAVTAILGLALRCYSLTKYICKWDPQRVLIWEHNDSLHYYVSPGACSQILLTLIVEILWNGFSLNAKDWMMWPPPCRWFILKIYHFASVPGPSKKLEIQGYHVNPGYIINLLCAVYSDWNALGFPSSVKRYQLSPQKVYGY